MFNVFNHIYDTFIFSYNLKFLYYNLLASSKSLNYEELVDHVDHY